MKEKILTIRYLEYLLQYLSIPSILKLQEFDLKIQGTVQNLKPRICQQSCLVLHKRLLSVAERDNFVKMQNQPFANEFARAVFAFLLGSEQIQIMRLFIKSQNRLP